jgi:hypothetical protein
LVFLGGCGVGVTATTITLLQTRVPRAMTGRVMSLNTLLMMGVRPLGDFAAAAAIGWLGASRAAASSAIIVAAVAMFVATRARVRDA